MPVGNLSKLHLQLSKSFMPSSEGYHDASTVVEVGAAVSRPDARALLWLHCHYVCDIAGRRQRDAIVMDAPIWYHTPKLILWCIFEALDLFLVIWVTRKPSCSQERFIFCTTYLSWLPPHA